MLWFAALAVAAPPPLEAEALREVVRLAVEEWEIAPGVVIGWVSPGGSGVVGWGDSGDPTRPTVDGETVFEVGSITKVFTSLVLADMVARGEVRLDEPLSAFAPTGTIFASERVANTTIVELATHTSGLPRLPFTARILAGGLYARANPYRSMNEAAVWGDTAGVGDAFLGQGYAYSNLGVALLGHALAARAGMPYATLVSQRLLAPLGMSGSGFNTVSGPFAHGHGVNHIPVPAWTMNGYAPAGGLLASGNDLVRFLEANLDGTAPGAGLAHPVRVEIDEDSAIGLGWHIAERRGKTITWHNGGTGGFRAWLGFDATAGTGVFVLANAEHSVDRLGAWLLGGMRTPPGAPDISPLRLGALGGLAGYGMALVGLRRVGSVRSPRLGVLASRLLGGGRREAVLRLFRVSCALALFATILDFRAIPSASVATLGAVAIVSQLWLVRCEWETASKPIGAVARGWLGVTSAVLGWVSWVAPWWG